MQNYHVEWYREDKRALLCHLRKLDSWNALYDMIKAEFAMLDTVSHPVHIIIKIGDVPPMLPRALPNVKRVLELVHANERVKIVVGAQLVFSTFYNVVHKVYRGLDNSYRFVPTMEAADEVLEELLAGNEE